MLKLNGTLELLMQMVTELRRTIKRHLKWFFLAAEQGMPKPKIPWVHCTESGHSVPQDYEEALKWFRLAADQGFAEAQVNLGRMYALGEGVSQDFDEALKWFQLAADQGDARGPNQHRDNVRKWARRSPRILMKP